MWLVREKISKSIVAMCSRLVDAEAVACKGLEHEKLYIVEKYKDTK